MKYMENHFDLRTDPTKLVPGAKSVISLLYNYYQNQSSLDKTKPKIAKYAFGDDYHFIIKEKLYELLHTIEKEGGIWTEGRHTRAKGFLEDMKKYNAYSMLGIYLIRFSTEQIEKTPIQCVEIIKQTLCEKNIGKICELIKK